MVVVCFLLFQEVTCLYACDSSYLCLYNLVHATVWFLVFFMVCNLLLIMITLPVFIIFFLN